MTELVVTAPSRLHFGMLDPAGLGARRFGGFGVGIEFPRVVVSVGWAASTSEAQIPAGVPAKLQQPLQDLHDAVEGQP